VVEMGLFSAAVLLMGWLGPNELAAHAVALQCAGTAFMIPLGLSQATTVRIGRAHGAKDAEGIRIAGWVSYGIGTGFMLVTTTVFWLMPNIFISFFLDSAKPENAAAFTLAVGYLGVAALFQLVDAGQVIGAAILRGMSDTAWPLFIAVFGYWIVGMPVAYLLGFEFGLRGLGIWYGLAAGLAVVAVILLVRFMLRERLGMVDYDKHSR
jgi:multidrug resistance protein, MATE family